MHKSLKLISLLACFVALVVIMLGAYVRLSDAGLGCPDWPGCYGQIGVPTSASEISAANSNFARPVEIHKAWKEMVHRYLASGLGLLILIIWFMALRTRNSSHPVNMLLPSVLVLLVIFQGMLGMWTVTLLVKPIIVTAHLIFGMTTLALLWLFYLKLRVTRPPLQTSNFRPLIMLGLALLIGQIALGGWVSTNYAAVACTDFPGCFKGDAWPESMDFKEGFVLWRGLGVDYEFGVLDSPARMAVHMTHRIGAVILLLYWLWLSLRIYRQGKGIIRPIAVMTLGLLIVQWLLGISNVLLKLPLPVAVAHNGGAALLFVAVVTLGFYAVSNRDASQ